MVFYVNTLALARYMYRKQPNLCCHKLKLVQARNTLHIYLSYCLESDRFLLNFSSLITKAMKIQEEP